ncbi:sensor histidine kinase [Agromyces sp. H66]|uniref:sensor histidine kinase n=1 Tax=Agromyces sp. H66 TaxID=2529859 RepID=UPI0010AAFABB|nr:sensor histidine kinase [Agromyces sp. H66]
MTRALATSRIATIVALCVSLVAAVGAIAFDLRVLPEHPDAPMSSGWSGVLPGVAMLVPGCLLLWRLPWHPIAVVLAGFGTLWVIDGLASAAVNLAWYEDRDAWWAVPAFWMFTRLGSVLILPIVLLLLLFPDGRLRRGRGWRAVSIVAIVLGLVMPFAFLFVPYDVLASDDPLRTELLAAFEPPLPTIPLPDVAWVAILAAALPCLIASLLLALVVAVSRRFGATAEERAQLRWLVWSGVVFVASLAIAPLLPAVLVDVLVAVTIALMSASVVVAVTRHRLYAIDRLLSWTLVYAVLIAAIVAVDVLVVLAVGSAIDDRAAMLVAVVVVMLAYAPLRGRLFALASLIVNGRRSDPYGVVSSLGDRLDRATDTPTRLGDLAAAIAEAFASPYVRVELDRPDADPIVAEQGTPTAALEEIPIDYGGAVVGRILMEPGRRPVVSERDQRLLGDLVRLAVAAMRNAELGRELQAIRERLVVAREEERSRLRRELHDGLGPLLGGVKLRLETARNLAERDPERSLALLDAAIDDQSEVIDEIRRIVHDLRPPALDDLGLVRALEQQATRLTGGGLAVEVSGDLPRELPPAVEVAAYRIVSEALTNARRHSGAAHVVVRLELDERMLRAEVRDDGAGIPVDAVGGVGLRSLRERAAELGGTLEIGPADGRGTVVRAALPLGHPVAPPDGQPEPEAETPMEATADA